jgi:hypothetical protein
MPSTTAPARPGRWAASSPGFLLLFAEPGKHQAVRGALGDRLHVPFRFESAGSQVIFYEPEADYDEADRARWDGEAAALTAEAS